jgi:hypothetical protein
MEFDIAIMASFYRKKLAFALSVAFPLLPPALHPSKLHDTQRQHAWISHSLILLSVYFFGEKELSGKVIGLGGDLHNY